MAGTVSDIMINALLVRVMPRSSMMRRRLYPSLRPVNKKKPLEKQEAFQSITIIEELNDTSYTHIRGQILSHTNVSADEVWKKHAEVKNIILYYNPAN